MNSLHQCRSGVWVILQAELQRRLPGDYLHPMTPPERSSLCYFGRSPRRTLRAVLLVGKQQQLVDGD